MKAINSIAFETIGLFNDSIRCVASAMSIAWLCSNWVVGRVGSRIDLVITKEERKPKKVINSQNEVAFADVFWSHTGPMFKIISSRQNRIGAKMSSNSSNLITFSTHRIGLKSDNHFLWKSGACS